MQIWTFYIYDVTTGVALDKCVTACGFKERAHKFSLTMVNVKPKHVEETQKMYVMNKYCAIFLTLYCYRAY